MKSGSGGNTPPSPLPGSTGANIGVIWRTTAATKSLLPARPGDCGGRDIQQMWGP